MPSLANQISAYHQSINNDLESKPENVLEKVTERQAQVMQAFNDFEKLVTAKRSELVKFGSYTDEYISGQVDSYAKELSTGFKEDTLPELQKLVSTVEGAISEKSNSYLQPLRFKKIGTGIDQATLKELATVQANQERNEAINFIAGNPHADQTKRVFQQALDAGRFDFANALIESYENGFYGQGDAKAKMAILGDKLFKSMHADFENKLQTIEGFDGAKKLYTEAERLKRQLFAFSNFVSAGGKRYILPSVRTKVPYEDMKKHGRDIELARSINQELKLDSYAEEN